MFTKSLGRVVGRTAQSLPQPCSTTAVAIALPRTHQRRPSSSKASSSPGGPADQAASNATRTPTEEQKRSGRLTRRKSRDNAAEVATKARDDAFANLPSVPSTSNLQPTDIGLSTFFSQHRPISLTAPIPPHSDPSSFAAIFESRTPHHKSTDVIYTLSSAVSAFEGDSPASSSEEKDLRWELTQQSSSSADGSDSHHMATPSLEQLVKQFRPFNVPPPPVPFEEAEAAAKERKVAAAVRKQQRRGEQQAAEGEAVTHKTFTTTLTINEATSPTGKKTYTASASPIVEREGGAGREKMIVPRARGRRVLEEGTGSGRQAKRMLLISVKRQRKLKMKKHKYKKLMKRTRNLRRREGRT